MFLLYEGDYKNNLKDGKRIKYNDGDKYKGDFNNNEFESKWINYKGDFKNNVFEDKGIYYYYNADKFKGDFKNNVFESKRNNIMMILFKKEILKMEKENEKE